MADMAPWDAFAWFDTPRESSVSLPLGGTVILAPAEVRRVVLILATPGGAYQASILPNAGSSNGISFLPNAGSPPVIITQASHGPLCQVAWYGYSGTGGAATVIELLLRDWPADRAPTPNAQLQATIALTRALEELTSALRQR